MEKKRLDELAKALTDKGANLPCPRCNNQEFSIVGEGYISLNPNPNKVTIGSGPVVRTVIVACEKCGYMTQHAKGPLELQGVRQ